MAGVAPSDIHLHFERQAWHAWHWAGSGGALGFRCDAAAFCVAGVALGDIHRHFAWQAWHLVTSTVTLRGRRGTHGIGLALVARLVLGVTPWRRGVLRGRRGTWRHPPSLCVAGVALGDIHRHFAWQAWHAWHWAGSGGALGFRCDAVALRRFVVASVAPSGIHLHFAWQAWHAWHWAGSGGADIHRHFAWQAWHAWHWTGSGGALGFRCDAVAPRRFAWQA